MTPAATTKKKKQVCKNCKSENINNYCSACGQRVYAKRFTMKSFFYVILGTLNIERGFFHTILMLFINPGKLINHYLRGKTKSYYNPLKYVILIVGIFAFLMILTNAIDTSYNVLVDNINNSNEVLKKQDEILKQEMDIQDFQQKWLEKFKPFLNLIPLLLIPFISLTSKWFYSSKRLFYGEFLIINCFIFAQTFVISIVLSIPIILLIPPLANYFPLISLITSIIYFIYALQSLFKDSPVITVFKSIFIYIIGALLFYVFIIIIMLLLFLILILLGLELTDFV